MVKKNRKTVQEEVDESPRRVAKKALRASADAGTKSRPEGLLVLKLSDVQHLRAEISDFTGTEQFVLQRWMKTKKVGWVRTKARLGFDLKVARDLPEAVGAAIAELLPRKKKKT
jgi:hypothetical protein